MCAADTFQSVPAKWPITKKLSKREQTNLKCLSDSTAKEEPQLRAGSNIGTIVDLADFKKAHETVLFISSFCCVEAIYAEPNKKQRDFPDHIKQVIKSTRLIIQ